MTLMTEARQALRSLLKQPGFFLTAVLTLALGVGAVSAVYSVVHGVLLKPLPYPEPERIVEVRRVQGQYGGPVSRPLYLDWQAGSAEHFSALAAWTGRIGTLTAESGAERVQMLQVTPSFFPLMGMAPAAGRWFDEAEEARGERVTVLSHALWQSRYAGDPGIVGRTLTIDGRPHMVVGIAPAALKLPAAAELYVPTFLPTSGTDRGTNYLMVLGRLAPGVDAPAALARLDALNAALLQQYPEEYTNFGVRLVPLAATAQGGLATPLWNLFAAALLVLLIACANLANLMLARAGQREAELAVRAALGASRLRLAGVTLIEAGLIGLIGGGMGVLLAALGVPLLLAGTPELLPAQAEVRLDLGVVAVSLALGLGTLLLFALLPAHRAARTAPAGSLSEAGRGPAAGRGSARVRRALVVTEVALALALLSGAGLMIESLRRLGAVDAGVETRGVLTANVVLTLPPGPDGEGWEEIYRRMSGGLAPRIDALLATVAALPGVEAVGISDALPLSAINNMSSTIRVIGADAPEGKEPGANWRFVNPDYFAAVGQRIERGRGLTDADARVGEIPTTVLVNRTFAERHLGGAEAAIGRQIEFVGGTQTIVGVVGDARLNGPARAVVPEVYLHHHHGIHEQLYLALRVQGDPLALAEPLRRALKDLDPTIPVSELRPFAALADALTGEREFHLRLMGLFSVLALGLAAVGLYGVISHGVQQRRQELGIRMSLGADAPRLLRLLLGQVLRLIGTGLALGLVGAWLLGRALQHQLYGVGAIEPGVLLGVAVLLGGVALIAGLLPSLGAVRTDPIRALRGA
ncbi:MAG: ADOP family duplicated permease [Xanthomonadales bacterium]|jgi:predicted permease|nr:ADOP family duplicated permease [Xanthomonadales bacterium]